MRLTLKLTIALTVAILLVLTVNSFIRVRRELALFEADVPKDDRLLGRTIAGAASRVWERVGEAEALGLIEDANERESGVAIRWVWLDAPEGDPRAPRGPIPGGGEDITSVHWRPPGEADEVVYTIVPLRIPGPRRIAIELQESLAAERAYVTTTIIQAVIATSTLVAICASLVLAFGIVFVGRPVRTLVAHARRIGEGELAARLEVKRHDELGELGSELNALSERLAASRQRLEAEAASKIQAIEQLRHSDRLATVGKLAAGVAHEVGTPLNVITGHARLVADDHPAGSPTHENAIIIDEQANRVAAIVRQLLDFARPRASRRSTLPLVDVVRRTASMLENIAQKRGVVLAVADDDRRVTADFDPMQIEQVLTNLIVNAIQASGSGSGVEISVDRRTATRPATTEPAMDYACVVVRDRGVGISADHLHRVFEPFFTTKGVGDGTGLGLAVAYGIVNEHGGWIAVESTAGRGSCFTVYLPAGAS